MVILPSERTLSTASLLEDCKGSLPFRAVGTICSSRTDSAPGLSDPKNVTLDLKACAFDCTAAADDGGSSELASSLFNVVVLQVAAAAKH